MASPAWTAGKTSVLRTLLAGDDGPGPVGLSCEGLVVAGRSLLGVGPHRWPRARTTVLVLYRLGLETLVLLGVRASFGVYGVAQLSIGGGLTASPSPRRV